MRLGVNAGLARGMSAFMREIGNECWHQIAVIIGCPGRSPDEGGQQKLPFGVSKLLTQRREMRFQYLRHAQKDQMTIGPQAGFGIAFGNDIGGTPHEIEEFLRHVSSLLIVARSGTSLSHSRRMALPYCCASKRAAVAVSGSTGWL